MNTSPLPWVSVVIPIKDERDNIPLLASQLLTFFEGRPESATASFELVFVDDGSTDGSEAVLDELVQQSDAVRVIHLDKNHGQTAAFDAGFRQAKGELIATMDGDLQYDPADFAKLLVMVNQVDLVCGRRAARHDNMVRRWSSRIANQVRNWVVHDGIADTGCSLKIFRRAVVERMPLFKNMHRFFPALAQMYGFTVTEVPVQHFPRTHGLSKYGVGNRLFVGLYDLFAVRWMQKRCLNYTMRESQHPKSQS
ncbi:MAG: glycosyltransferase family 2 protein [Nitrospirota bacterium]|nr:glycosyltransferase family 2 protein [Nitrospirota bacterium]MDH5774832.1 glycosyltransferase family 2 protein [Nitrospirota bacterium]